MVCVGTVTGSAVVLLAGLGFGSAQCYHTSTQGPCFYDTTSPYSDVSEYSYDPDTLGIGTICDTEARACHASTSCSACFVTIIDSLGSCRARLSFDVEDFTCIEQQDAICCYIEDGDGCDSNVYLRAYFGEPKVMASFSEMF